MTWLKELVSQHSELESPVSFWYWSALAAISATVKDNVYWDKYLYKLYPNIYVMLHADSGMKKGPPISMAKQLVREVNGTKIISGRSSIQGILKRLSQAESKPGGTITTGSTAFIASSELTSSIVDDKAANEILTDLFDRHYNPGDWESLLKMESFKLKDCTITMLTATNKAHSDEFFTKKDVQGGFFARTFIIYEKESNVVNSLMFPLTQEIDYKKSAIYLKEIAKLKGPFVIEKEVREYFDTWYKQFKQSVRGYDDPTGTLNRFDDTVLKVAMLVSLGTHAELNIKIESVIEAISQCEKLIGNVRKATMGQGKSQFAQEKGIIIQELVERNNHMISRMQLNRKYWMRASDKEWDEIMLNLESAGAIRIESHGNQVIYRMVDDQVEVFRKYFEGKKNQI